MSGQNGNTKWRKRRSNKDKGVKTVALTGSVPAPDCRRINVHFLMRSREENPKTWNELKLSLQQEGPQTQKVGTEFIWRGGKGLQKALNAWLDANRLPRDLYVLIDHEVVRVHSAYVAKQVSVPA
jgi:hypothetical protein